VLFCLHTLWLRCHLSQARCGRAGSCVCGCFALGPSSRIFIINEVTDYRFHISSCSMCWADVVALLLEWEWITVQCIFFFPSPFTLMIYFHRHMLNYMLFISHNQTAHVLCARSFSFSFTCYVLIHESSRVCGKESTDVLIREKKGPVYVPAEPCLTQCGSTFSSTTVLECADFWEKSPYEFLSVIHCIQLTASFDSFACKDHLLRAIN